MSLRLEDAIISGTGTVDGERLLPSGVQPLSDQGPLHDWVWKLHPFERVPVNFTEQDHDPFRGTLCLGMYIGIWIFSCVSTPLTFFLLIMHYYTAGCVLLLLMALCYILPITPSETFRNFSRRYLGRYFKEASIRFEHVPNPKRERPTILCINPHGVFSLSWAHCYLTNELYHLRWCFSTLLRLSPFFRVITQLTGQPSNVRKSTIIDHMLNSRSIALIPGGWHEATIHNHEVDRIYIKKRQGFVKYALQFGYTITPTYGFGERQTYSNIQGCYKFRFWLNSHGILGIIPWGRRLCPLLPRPVKLHTVIGTPIELPHIPRPTKDDVDRWHKVYMDTILDLYDRYKVEFYGKDAENKKLEMW